MENISGRILLIKILDYNIAVPIEMCESVDVYTGETSIKKVHDLTELIYPGKTISVEKYLRLKDKRIISFSTFEGIVFSQKKYIELPSDIFYNRSIRFSFLYYHKSGNEYYPLLGCSLS